MQTKEQQEQKLHQSIAEWLEAPLTPGKKAALKRWLDADPDHTRILQRFKRLNTDAGRLQINAPDFRDSWDTLRDSIGLKRITSGKKAKPRRDHHEKVEFYRRPLVAAILAMALLSLFLYALFLIRVNVGF